MPQVNDSVIAPRVRAVENMVARARAKTGKKPGPPACATCHVPLWLGFFFDGTNNHMERDFPKRHSNVVALFQAHKDARSVDFFLATTKAAAPTSSLRSAISGCRGSWGGPAK